MSPSAATSAATTFADYCVKIYECESTGGSEWKLEDCLNLNSIVLPELDSGIDFDYIFGTEKPIKPSRSMHSFKTIVLGNNNTTSNGISNSINNNSINHNNTSSTMLSSSSMSFLASEQQLAKISQLQQQSQHAEIPSTAARVCIKRQFSNLNSSSSQQTLATANGGGGVSPSTISPNPSKKQINLDWGSCENGSHILTIGLGNRVLVYSCVSKEEMASSSSSFSSNAQANRSNESAVASSLSSNTMVCI